MNLNGYWPVTRVMNFCMCKLTPVESRKGSVVAVYIIEMSLPGNVDT